MPIYVQNASGTSRFSKPKNFNSWLEYWEHHCWALSIDKLYKCPACGNLFYRQDFDGAHVIKVFSKSREMFIVPLCSGCNHRTDFFTVDGRLLLPVPSNL